jgi:hypothetical protein
MILRAIECDRCRFILDPVSVSTNAEARAKAREAGWTRNRDDGGDYCPECTAVRMHAVLSERGRHAARSRWGNRSGPSSDVR